MANSTKLSLPLVAASQAQKHVTVNESLLRLDGLVNLVLQGTALAQPPAVVEGECWGVPAGAMGAWEGQAGRIASIERSRLRVGHVDILATPR